MKATREQLAALADAAEVDDNDARVQRLLDAFDPADFEDAAGAVDALRRGESVTLDDGSVLARDTGITGRVAGHAGRSVESGTGRAERWGEISGRD